MMSPMPHDRSAYFKAWRESGKAKISQKIWLSKPENAANNAGHANFSKAAKRTTGEIAADLAERELMRKMYRIVHHMNKLYGPRTWSVDHVQPLSKGGAHRLSNMQILPLLTNQKKAAHV